MNERIRELAEQADGVFIHKLITGAKQYTFLEKDLEKFAELIIQECVRHINEDYQRDYLTNWREDLSSSIKYHFGVNNG